MGWDAATRTPAHRCGVRCVPAPEALGGLLRAQGEPRGGGGGRPQTGSATQPVPPGAVCAHGARRARPGSSSLRTNPVLLPLSVALGGLSGPSGVARAPRSAVHPPSAAAAGLSGSRLFSSQAGSGTCPAGAAASSGAAPQGRHEAEIGAGAACERRKQAGKEVRKGPSLAEVGEAFFELRCAWGCSRRVCSSRRGKRPPSGCEGRASCCYRFSCCITPRTIRILPFLLRLHHRIIHSLHEDLSIKCIELRGAQRNLDGSKLFCI